ncbi:MAG: hypothetical protein HC800_13605 [Phormidesmis sp. RL_2_1]|nr:hypothetical protein [Phormidesmis sp. RL_2_1]
MSLVISGKYLNPDSMYAQHSRPSELKGIAIADLGCGGIFVKASVQDTVEAISQLFAISEWVQNCYGKHSVISENPALLVFQFLNSPWTIVLEAIHPYSIEFTDTNAQSISKQTSAEVICCTYDSDNMSEYTVFDSGEVIEKLEYIDTKIKGYENANGDIDTLLDNLIERGEEIVSEHYCRYFSASQNIDTVSVYENYDTLQRMLVEREAFLPIIVWKSLR